MPERFRLPAVLTFSALLLYAALLLFSLNYQTILPGLDPSWAYALNQFAHGPEVFGRDLILTYGPLAYIAVPQHIGNNLQVSLLIHVAIWCLLIYQLVLLWDTGQKIGAFFFLLGLIATNRLYYYYYDYFLNVVIILALTLLLRRPEMLSMLAVLAAMIGISFLVKFTAFILSMLLLGIYVVSRLAHRKQIRRQEYILLLVALFSGPIAYLIYNPSLSDLVGYIKGSLSVSSGYSAVMSYVPPPDLASRAWVLCSVLGACVAFSAWKRWISPAGAAMVIVMAWVAFKHGYVRSEPWHASIFFCLIVLAMSFLLAQQSFTIVRGASFLFIFAGITFYALSGVSKVWPVTAAFWWSPALNLAQAAQLMKWKQTVTELDLQSSDAFRSSLITDYEAALGTSSVLFFPWDVSYGAYRKFITVPLYATQAYTAYTHLLDEGNAKQITIRSPPLDYVLWETKTIDGRNPLLDVPATWNALYSEYAPVSSRPDSILLKRRLTALPIAFQRTGTATCRVEEWHAVTPATTPLAISLSLPPTLRGSIWTALYQQGAVFFEAKTKAGVQVKIRFPPDVVSFPFPLNYLPLDAAAVDALWTKNRVLDPVVAFRLTGPGFDLLQCSGIQIYNVTGTPITID